MLEDPADYFEVFPWNKNFDTGISKIDEQHKQLVHLINQLAVHMAHKSTSIKLNQVFDELIAYADYHFKTEENIWKSYFKEDARFTDHQHIHNTFVSKVLELKNEEDSKLENEVLDDILKLLTHWLAHHILDSDKRMAKTIQAVESGLPLEQAKSHADQEMSGSMQILIETVLGMYDSLSTRTLELMRERSERKRVEAKLRKSERHEKIFSDGIINSIPGLLYLYDDKLKLIRWNKKHSELTGYSDKELANKSVLDFFEKDDQQRIKDEIETLYQEGSIEVEEAVLSKDGARTPYMFSAVPMVVDGKNYISGIALDISHIKESEKTLEESIRASKEALLGVVAAISKALEIRDPYTAGHQLNTSAIATAIAEKLNLDSNCVEGVNIGASIHDIGNFAIPIELLAKPAQLTELEFTMVKGHAEAGIEILEGIAFPWPIAEIVLQHHERLDGTGYPNGLKGDEICLEARIVAVADVFAAMTSHRPYRSARETSQAIDELKDNREKLYDADAVDALLSLLHENLDRFKV